MSTTDDAGRDRPAWCDMEQAAPVPGGPPYCSCNRATGCTYLGRGRDPHGRAGYSAAQARRMEEGR